MKDTRTTYASASFNFDVSPFMSSMRLPFVFCSLALAALSAAMSGCDSYAANADAGGQTQAASGAAVKAGAAPHAQSRADVFAHVKQMTALGEKLFSDPSLSGSGKLACASCHTRATPSGHPMRCPCSWAATTCVERAFARCRRSGICNWCRRLRGTSTIPTTKATKASMPARPAA